MKTKLLTILRLLVAGLGVTFILWSLTWHDQLVLPAGYLDHLGPQQTEPVAVRVETRPDLTSDGQWLVRLPERYGGELESIPTAEVGTAQGDVTYQPGVLRTLLQARWSLLAVGLLLVVLVPVGQALRWWLLMRCRGLDPGYVKSLRLSLVGMFFNFSLPGMTGGDLVKAYYAAKGSGARATAVMSVVFDRLTGLIGLVVLAAVAGLIVLHQPEAAKLTAIVWLVLASIIIGGHLYLSRRVRRWLAPVQRLLMKAGPAALLARVDEAAAAYRDHLRTVYLAVLISVPVHLAQMVGVGLAGQALGMDVSLAMLVAVLPVVFFAGCLPISYQGLGVMEATAMALLAAATANEIVGMLLIGRLFILFYALFGAFVLLRGGIHLFPQQIAEAMAGPDGKPAEV